MAGFGHSKFGKNPFGKSDPGGDLVVNLFPEEYFDSSLKLGVGQSVYDNDVDPLLMLLKTYANSVNLRREDVENFSKINDPDTAPLNIVQLQGGVLGLDIDQNDPESLQRTFLKTASQWLQIKGSTKGYEVRGLASGFQVQVNHFWRIDDSYQTIIPPRFLYDLKPSRSDLNAQTILHTDQPPGTFPGTPSSEDETYAKSSYVRVIYTIPNGIYNPDIDYNAALNQAILKMADVIAIHHEIVAPQFLVPITIDVSHDLKMSMTIHEWTHLNEYEGSYFDANSADLHPLDQPLNIRSC